jgi:hypothetical protein
MCVLALCASSVLQPIMLMLEATGLLGYLSGDKIGVLP